MLDQDDKNDKFAKNEGDERANKEFKEQVLPLLQEGKVSEARYDEAVSQHIKANARKGAYTRWLAEGEGHQELNDWLVKQSKSVN